MDPIRIHSLAEQVAAHLRKQILMGKLSGMMPGVHQVAKELAISSKTIVAALKILEHEGLLEGQGPRRRRKIVLPENHVPSVLRVYLYSFVKKALLSECDCSIFHSMRLQ